MGSILCSLIPMDPRLALLSAIESPSHPALGAPASAHPGAPLIGSSLPFDRAPDHTVALDFSTPSGAENFLENALKTGLSALIGTTALSPGARAMARELAQRARVCIAPNTSLGAAAHLAAARAAARILGAGADASIIETHHRAKKDAPSGTALALAANLRSLGVDVPDRAIHSIRAADVVGTHALHLTIAGETLELVHRVQSREVFARGALDLAHWLAQQPIGLYTVDDFIASRLGSAE